MIAFGGISLFISLLPSVVEKFYVTNFHVIQIVLTFAACVMVIIYGLKIMRSKISLEKLEEQTSDRMHFAEEKAKDIKKKAWGIKEKAKDFTNQHGISKKSKSNNGGQLLMGILLTMSSITLPASWFAIVGYIKGFGIINSSFWGGFWFSLGAFAGTALWFYTLLKLITSNKHRISHVTINTINVIAGYILIFLGIFLFIKAAYTIYS
jgi:cation transport ATPase